MKNNMHLASDSQRRIENIVRLGVIAEVDPKNALARVQTGEILTDFLPWLTFRAGQTVSFSALDVGEQVLLISPSGDLSQGVILTGLYCNKNAPSVDPNEHIFKFADGAVLSYNQASHLLTVSGITDLNLRANGKISAQFAGDANLTIGGNLQAKVNGSATVEAPSITLKGNVTIDGNLSVSGTSQATDHISGAISGVNHKHIGNAGVPTSPPTP